MALTVLSSGLVYAWPVNPGSSTDTPHSGLATQVRNQQRSIAMRLEELELEEPSSRNRKRDAALPQQ
jgi:hypothetical protein